VSWYVIREIPRPPYEEAVSEHATEAEAYDACPDDPAYEVAPWSCGPTDDEADCEPSLQGEWG